MTWTRSNRRARNKRLPRGSQYADPLNTVIRELGRACAARPSTIPDPGIKTGPSTSRVTLLLQAKSNPHALDQIDTASSAIRLCRSRICSGVQSSTKPVSAVRARPDAARIGFLVVNGSLPI